VTFMSSLSADNSHEYHLLRIGTCPSQFSQIETCLQSGLESTLDRMSHRSSSGSKVGSHEDSVSREDVPFFRSSLLCSEGHRSSQSSSQLF
ncbi:hypothetical protein PMAYCL1PPCAC_03172, partial [Pristionchus mayeri]